MRVNETYGEDLESLTGWSQASLGYDGAWTMALTLQMADDKLRVEGKAKQIHYRNYSCSL